MGQYKTSSENLLGTCRVPAGYRPKRPMSARLLNPAGASRGYIPDGHRRNWDLSLRRAGMPGSPTTNTAQARCQEMAEKTYGILVNDEAVGLVCKALGGTVKDLRQEIVNQGNGSSIANCLFTATNGETIPLGCEGFIQMEDASTALEQPSAQDASTALEQPSAQDASTALEQPSAQDASTALEQPSAQDASTALEQPSTQDASTALEQPSTQDASTALEQPSTQDASTALEQPSAQDASTALEQPSTQDASTALEQPSTQDASTALEQPSTQDASTALEQPSAQDASTALENQEKEEGEEEEIDQKMEQGSGEEWEASTTSEGSSPGHTDPSAPTSSAAGAMGIRNSLLESGEHVCPSCKKTGTSPESVIPNKFLREVVNKTKAKLKKQEAASDSVTTKREATKRPPSASSSSGALYPLFSKRGKWTYYRTYTEEDIADRAYKQFWNKQTKLLENRRYSPARMKEEVDKRWSKFSSSSATSTTTHTKLTPILDTLPELKAVVLPDKEVTVEEQLRRCEWVPDFGWGKPY
ncbi:E3 ubiquitin-protein ligase rbbp6 [Branchiostoma belcheri]|nr:E3 ubiquitin-protein ligase rbbp6 [Branchiostoma belcheri]